MRIGLLDSGIGVVPFIKEIIKQGKNNDYYIFMDENYFPYGEKTELQMINHVNDLLEHISKFNIELLLVCCNTLSYFIMNYKYQTKFEIKTILELNMSKGFPLLTTSLLSKKINSLDGRNLASLIENNQINEIIMLIKSFKIDEVTLSCTHYPLIKNIINLYHHNIYSFEDEFVNNLPSTKNNMSFHILLGSRKRIREFFPELRIIEGLDNIF